LSGRKDRGTNCPRSGATKYETTVATNSMAIRRPSVIIPKTTKNPTTTPSSSSAESPGNNAKLNTPPA